MFLTLCLSVQELRNTGSRAEDAASEKDGTLCVRGTRRCGRVHRRTRRKRAVVPRDESRSGRLLGEQETQLARRTARGASEGRRLRMSTPADEKETRGDSEGREAGGKHAREDRKLGSGEPYSGW